MATQASPVADITHVDPQTPHDDMSFEELASSYNFRRTSNDMRAFTRLIMKECERREGPIKVLDIGCGRGIGRQQAFQHAIRKLVDVYHGLEPDETAAPPDGLFDAHQFALMEDADLEENAYDVVYSAMVMEHVENPEAFMTAVARCLKPGGVYMFVTPNRGHYFTRIASTLERLGLDEFALRMLHGKAVDAYHYPVYYRFNGERGIKKICTNLKLREPEFVYLEAIGPRGYMKGPLRPLYHLLAWKRKIYKSKRALLAMVCRIRKPDDERTEPGRGNS